MNQVFNRSSSGIGLLCLWGFVIGQAIRDVYLGELFGTLGLYEIALLSFGLAAVVFGSALALFRRAELAVLWKKRRYVLALNITTMISWLFYFKALSLIEPAAVNLAFCGVAPVAVLGMKRLGFFAPGESAPGPFETSLHLLLLVAVVVMFVVVATGNSGSGDIGYTSAMAGVGLASIAGVSITAETVFAKRMNLEGVSPSAIVGVRFLMVAAFSALALAGENSAYSGYDSITLGFQALVFLAIIILPIYLVQAGVALTSPLVTGVICSLGPTMTWALQSLVGSVASTPQMAIVLLIYTAIAIAAAIAASARKVTDPVTARPGRLSSISHQDS